MSRDWESVFITWAQGPSATEKQKAENAERLIREAIGASTKLKSRNINVFTQGSYKNRVNVRRESDVDIGVVCFDTFFPDYADNNVKVQLSESFSPAVYTYAEFKNELEEALVDRFGRADVTRGSKAFDVAENTYRVEADVAAFFEHRRYTSITNYHSGVEMIPDDLNPAIIRNWPEQHYKNGVDKNNSSGRRYKRMVRVLKSLSSEMAANGIQSAKKAPSFLIECLTWNTPNEYLIPNTYTAAVRATLAYLFNNTLTDDLCTEWGEVSELKYLFKGSQPWTRQSAHEFLSDAWDYLGFK